MIHLDPLSRQRLQRGVEHLHGLGPRATAEALAEICDRIGGMPTVLAVLGEFSTINRQHLTVAGGDRFSSRPLHLVSP